MIYCETITLSGRRTETDIREDRQSKKAGGSESRDRAVF